MVVMNKYAKVRSEICRIISLLNIFEWFVLSILNRAYKEKLAAFVKENTNILNK